MLKHTWNSHFIHLVVRSRNNVKHCFVYESAKIKKNILVLISIAYLTIEFSKEVKWYMPDICVLVKYILILLNSFMSKIQHFNTNRFIDFMFKSLIDDFYFLFMIVYLSKSFLKHDIFISFDYYVENIPWFIRNKLYIDKIVYVKQRSWTNLKIVSFYFFMFNEAFIHNLVIIYA